MFLQKAWGIRNAYKHGAPVDVFESSASERSPLYCSPALSQKAVQSDTLSLKLAKLDSATKRVCCANLKQGTRSHADPPSVPKSQLNEMNQYCSSIIHPCLDRPAAQSSTFVLRKCHRVCVACGPEVDASSLMTCEALS